MRIAYFQRLEGKMDTISSYSSWEESAPVPMVNDPLWRMKVYRLSLFAADLGWHDVRKLMSDRRTLGVADQLYRALGSISANIAEGYSRGTGKARAQFYEYALGSARESRDWYYKSRHILGEDVLEHRLNLHTEIIRLLLTIVPAQRNTTIKEEASAYTPFTDNEMDSDPIPFS
jgi:four helix bundle protein